jgi:hypothetical protein
LIQQIILPWNLRGLLINPELPHSEINPIVPYPARKENTMTDRRIGASPALKAACTATMHTAALSAKMVTSNT